MQNYPCLVMLLFAALAFVPFILASKCKFELESVLAAPNTFPENYLRLLSNKLSQFSELLFTSQAASVISSFEQEYGVTVSLQAPFPVDTITSCNFYQYDGNSQPFLNGPFPFNITEQGQIYNLSIANIFGTLGNDNKALTATNSVSLQISFQAPNGFTSQVLDASCSFSSRNYQFGLADSSDIPFDCTTIGGQLTYSPTSPFSQFKGVEANGQWELILFSDDNASSLQTFRIDYCLATQPYYSSDIARSNLNFPGYRFDSGVAYFTSIDRNSQGEKLYVTISRSL